MRVNNFFKWSISMSLTYWSRNAHTSILSFRIKVKISLRSKQIKCQIFNVTCQCKEVVALILKKFYTFLVACFFMSLHSGYGVQEGSTKNAASQKWFPHSKPANQFIMIVRDPGPDGKGTLAPDRYKISLVLSWDTNRNFIPFGGNNILNIHFLASQILDYKSLHSGLQPSGHVNPGLQPHVWSSNQSNYTLGQLTPCNKGQLTLCAPLMLPGLPRP